MKQAGGISLGCLAVIVVVFLLVAVPLGVWGARVYFAEEIGRGNAEIQIQSAESRIPRYEQFFNLCTSVQNAEVSLDAEYNRLENTEDPQTREEIQTNISALTSVRGNGINEYNSNAAQGYTDAQFQASNLPARLSTDSYEQEGVKTQCAV